MDMYGIFPEPIGQFYLNRELTKSETKCIYKELKSLTINVGNKHSSNTQVLQNPELSALNKFCLESLNHYTQAVYEEKIDLRITQSWLNITIKNGYHHQHSHPNSFISGVFYIETANNDQIQFFKHYDNGSFAHDTKVFNQWNSNIISLKTNKLSLVIFKSHLRHAVPFVQDEQRISLSFNSFFDSDFGGKDTLQFLPVK